MLTKQIGFAIGANLRCCGCCSMATRNHRVLVAVSSRLARTSGTDLPECDRLCETDRRNGGSVGVTPRSHRHIPVVVYWCASDSSNGYSFSSSGSGSRGGGNQAWWPRRDDDWWSGGGAVARTTPLSTTLIQRRLSLPLSLACRSARPAFTVRGFVEPYDWLAKEDLQRTTSGGSVGHELRSRCRRIGQGRVVEERKPRGAPAAACHVFANKRLSVRSVAMAPDGQNATSEVPENPEKRLKTETYSFGPYPIDSREVFLETSLSFAFVNLKPVVPGHVLVSPKRVVKRYAELTNEEVADMWVTAQRVGRRLEPHYNGTSLTLTIQDGKEAGQTVPHVHIHILPRKAGDFAQNDAVYDAIDESEEKLSEKLNLDKMKQERTPEDMVKEAATLRALFADEAAAN